MPNYRKLPGLKGRLVTVEVGEHTCISKTARFGTGVKLRGSTRIAAGVEIGNNCVIESCDIKAGVIVNARVEITQSTVGAKSTIGRDSTIRDSTMGRYVVIERNANLERLVMEDRVEIGLFVRASDYILEGGVRVGDAARLRMDDNWRGRIALRASVGARCWISNTDLPEYQIIRDKCNIVGAVIGNYVSVGEGVMICKGSRIPDNWWLPDGVTVNPNPYGGPPVVVPAPPVGLERQVAELQEQLASLQKRLVGYGL